MPNPIDRCGNPFAALLVLSLFACGPVEPAPPRGPVSTSLASATAPATPHELTLSIIGTNDLHGRVLALPILGGYLANLRATRARDGGGVVLVDAGDMFQGTLESNLLEGAPVVAAYGKLGYAAAAVGNHEFDFGPAGPKATPSAPGDDPRGALKAAAALAPFPILIANALDAKSGARVDWPNMPATTMIEVAGVRVGIVGVTTTDTATTTISANVQDLKFAPLAETIGRHAAALRKDGASVVVAIAHEGGKCARFGAKAEADACEDRSEIFQVARALPKGSVDVIVAGHTHAGVAHEVAGIPIIEQFSYGRALGRVDLRVGGSPPRVIGHEIFAPRDLCPAGDKADLATCDPGSYEGARVVRDSAVQALLSPAIQLAAEKRGTLIGPTLTENLRRSYDEESPLGNLFADLLREATPGAAVAVMNGGGLRADLPGGKLTFGALFEAFPFDNRVATATLSGAALRDLLLAHAGRGGGILSLSGATLVITCRGDASVAELSVAGKRVRDDDKLLIVGSDFLFTGGDAFWGGSPPPPVTVSDTLMRDTLNQRLAIRASIGPRDVFDPKKPRMALPSRRPVRCKDR